VGNVRTALYNWAFARHERGTFVFRVEDTDRARVTEEHIHAAIDVLRWLGLDWDEGPEVGGPFGPYRQSERLELYDEWARTFLDSGAAYHCYCTPEEVSARAAATGRPPGYDGHCRELPAGQLAAYDAEGRLPVVRLRMPPGTTTFEDLIRGEVSFDSAFVPDFVLVRADGMPLYTLAVAVDDVLMRITHILRGEDLLPSTPRQMAVYRAMGVAPADMPRFGHLPFVLGEGNTKLSKRNAAASISWYRREGFLPEAVVNYLALLGWSLGEDRELFSLREMAGAFTLDRVNRNPARFDLKKLEAINGVKIRALDGPDFAARILPFLQRAGLVAHPPTEREEWLVRGGAPLVQERIGRLTEAVGMLGFLFVDEPHFAIDEQAAARVLQAEARPTLVAAIDALEGLADWRAGAIEAALRSALLDGLGLKPKLAFSPVRVAVTGRTVSPPLFESLELLGKDRTLARLRSAIDALPSDHS
jgi:glutamyl-tRNA synthetase